LFQSCSKKYNEDVTALPRIQPVELTANNRSLREELDRVTEDYADSDERLAKQIGLIKSLAAKYRAPISLVREMKPGELQFNCYQHSFCLTDVESVSQIMRAYQYIFPGREFVQHLIATRLRQIAVSEAQDGDHVLYGGSQIEHAGTIVQDSVESKWGKGHLWRHGLYDLPLRYGDTVSLLRRISKEDSIQAFLEYAKSKGAV